MGDATPDHGRPAFLLLSRDAACIAAVRREAAGLDGATLHVVSEPGYALVLLCASHRFSHLLLDPPAADGTLADLVALTAGEAEPGTALVILAGDAGDAHAIPGGKRAMAAPRDGVGWLRRAVAATACAPAMPDPVPLGELQAALAGGRLQLRYQPTVRLPDGAPLGLEALARLDHPMLGMLAADRFVPQLEAGGYASRLADTVARRAFADWGGDALARLAIGLAVNMPLDVLLRPGACDRLERWRRDAGIAAGRLSVELTETRPVGEPARLRRVLEQLRAAGYGVAADDVGPGLRDVRDVIGLPFTTLKLDRAVVRDSAWCPRALQFVKEVVAEARAAHMLVVAEGIEDREDWRRMAALGAGAAQGYFVARPLTVAAAGIWHAAWSRRRAA